MAANEGRRLLPHLTGTGIVRGDAGEWTEIAAAEQLAKLDFGDATDEALRTRIQSIPSPWARLLLFRNALEDEEHPGHMLVSNELLDAFEFVWNVSAMDTGTIQWQPLPLAEVNPLARRTGSARAESFAGALVQLAPRAGSALAIDTLHVGKVKGRPVLGTSPFTGLFTAEDAAGEGTGPYFRFMADPQDRPLSARPEPFQLYVARVLLPQLSLARAPGAGTWAAWGELSRVLGTWLRRQVEHAPVARAARPEARADTPVHAQNAQELGLTAVAGVGFGGLQLYQRSSTEIDSRWVLRPSRPGAARPLVLDSSVFDGYYFAGATRVQLPDLAHGDREVLPILGTRYPWVNPATDWLTEHVILLDRPLQPAAVQGLTAGVNYNWRGPADDPQWGTPRMTLPLRSEFFRFFAPEDIERMLTVDVQPKGEIDVQLRIPVGPAAQGGEVVVRKHYAGGAIVRPGPSVALWPAFRHPAWQHYTALRLDAQQLMARTWTLRAFDGAGAPIPTQHIRHTPLVEGMTFGQAPATLELVGALPGPDGETVSYGVLLPRYRAPGPRSGTRWHVGVDFGTSNTVLSALSEGEDTPRLFQASDMALCLTEPGPDTRGMLDGYFFPERIAPKPFGTAVVYLKERPRVALEQEPIGSRVTVPFGGHVYGDEWHHIRGDLKWSSDEHAYFLSSSFLRHVLAVIVTSALEQGIDPANITISWAFPRAFTPSQQNNLLKQWQGVLAAFGGVLSAGALRPQMDESRSVLRHFFNLGQVNLAGAPNAIVDIGGGTADIAAYGGRRVLFLDSIMLGGRILTGRPLRGGGGGQNPFVEVFCDWAAQNHLPDADREVVAAYRRAGQEHLAFTYIVGTEWFRNGGPNRFQGTETFQAFQRLIFYFFGGLFHYLGLSFRGVEEALPGGNLPTSIVLAGNGSRYLEWLTNLVPTDRACPFKAALGDILLRAAGAPADAPRPTITVSERQKEEVARGLVARVDAGALEAVLADGGSLAGEPVAVPVEGQLVEYQPWERLRGDGLIPA